MARKYRVTVNGKSYEVDVEEMGAGMPAPAPELIAAAPTQVPAVPAPAPAAPVHVASPAPSGTTTIAAPMPGKILKVLVAPGSAVTNGQLVIILEAMKMENEIFATVAGTVTQVSCKEGDSVNTGDILLVIG